MINPRALVRAAVKAALSDEDTGFNAQFAAIATSFGVTAYEVDFAAGSRDFLQSYVDPSTVEVSRFLRRELGIAIYTGEASDGTAPDRSKSSQFDGLVVGHVDVFCRFREGIEESEEDTEAYADAVETAVLQAIHDPAVNGLFFGGPVYYNYEFSCVRDPIISTEDGYEQRIPMQFVFSVEI